MKRLALVIGLPVLILAASFFGGIALVGLVYPEITVDGYDPNPTATISKDLDLDASRQKLFLGLMIGGAAAAGICGVWMSRRTRTPALAT